jgi:hypothetical protein
VAAKEIPWKQLIETTATDGSPHEWLALRGLLGRILTPRKRSPASLARLSGTAVFRLNILHNLPPPVADHDIALFLLLLFSRTADASSTFPRVPN